MKGIDLYCIPYAGGSAGAIYAKWKKKLQPYINVVPLELPGRGNRMSEPLCYNMDKIVVDVLERMSSIKERPYAIYAHSMGTVLVYELMKLIKEKGYPQPERIFLSGRKPPHLKYENENRHLLSDRGLIQELGVIGGEDLELYKSDFFIETFLPIIRNDFRVIEEYVFDYSISQFDCELVYLFSDQDVFVNSKDIAEWKEYTTQNLDIHHFKGGHLFINDYWQEICELINTKLALKLI